MQVFTPGNSKIEVSKTFVIMTTHNYHLSHVKHVLGSIHAFFYGYRVCVFWVLGHMLCKVDLPKAKEFSETDFFDILTIHNDQICYVKHVLNPLYVVFTLVGCLEGGGTPKGAGAQPAEAVFHPLQLNIRNFQN